MVQRVLKVHPEDNVLVAFQDLGSGEAVDYNGKTYALQETIHAKHKFFTQDLAEGDSVMMYGTFRRYSYRVYNHVFHLCCRLFNSLVDNEITSA